MNITITPRGPEKMRVMKITKQNDGSITCRLCFENFKNIHEVTRHAPHCRSLDLINQVDFDKSEEQKSDEPDNYYRTPGHYGMVIIIRSDYYVGCARIRTSYKDTNKNTQIVEYNVGGTQKPLNTQYMRNPDMAYLLKMEYVSKINIFGLKMILKSGVKKYF